MRLLYYCAMFDRLTSKRIIINLIFVTSQRCAFVYPRLRREKKGSDSWNESMNLENDATFSSKGSNSWNESMNLENDATFSSTGKGEV